MSGDQGAHGGAPRSSRRWRAASIGSALVWPCLLGIAGWAIPALIVELFNRQVECGSFWLHSSTPHSGEGAVCGLQVLGLIFLWLFGSIAAEAVAGGLSARIGGRVGRPRVALAAGVLGAAGIAVLMLRVNLAAILVGPALLPVIGFAAGFGLGVLLAPSRPAR